MWGKELKIKVRKFWEQIPMFVAVKGENRVKEMKLKNWFNSKIIFCLPRLIILGVSYSIKLLFDALLLMNFKLKVLFPI